MGSKYKKTFEREWEGKPLSSIRVKMKKRQVARKIKSEQEHADYNISRICKGKLLVRRRRYR